ncbi:MAG: O-antigen ligase family protein [candidate division Zixibacteria bacterium]|nr:O-antigen ligase family protein [candidate division Zixibacteria bacterium]
MDNKALVTKEFIWYGVLAAATLLLTAVGLYVDFLLSIGTVLAVLFVIVMLKKPYWGFILYVIMVYLRPADVIHALGAIRLQAGLLALLIVLWILNSFVFTRRGYAIEKIDRAIFGFLGVMGLSIFTSIYLSESVNLFTEFSKFVIFYVLASQMIRSEKNLKTFTYVVLGCVAFVCVIQIWTYLTIGKNVSTGLGGYGIHIGPLHLESSRPIMTGSDDNVHGVGGFSSGFLANASELGLGVLVLFPFAYYLIAAVKTVWHKFILGSLCALFVVSLVICGARGAFVGVIAVFGMIFWRSKHKLLIALSGLIFFAGLIPLLPDEYIDRIVSTANYEEDESANIRLTLWTAGLHMIIDRPILGMGVGNFSTAYGGTYRTEASANIWWEPHNIFVQAGTEMGLLGLAAFIYIMVVTFRENKKSLKSLRDLGEDKSFLASYIHAVDIGLVGYIVSGCFITSTYYPHLYLMGLLARTCSIIVREKVEKKKAEALLGQPDSTLAAPEIATAGLF